MAIPADRYKLLPLRGTKANLNAGVEDILDGEICYATDEDQYYQKEGSVLVSVGSTKAQGALADSSTQPGDSVSTLANDAGYITLAEVPGDLVTSVAGRVGDVVLSKSDITDFSEADYATAAQGAAADSAIQPLDNVSTLTNDAGYITLGEVPGDLVTSVQGRAGDVIVTKTDLNIENVDNTSDADKPVSTAQQAVFDVKADLVGGLIPTSQLPGIAISEFLGEVADEVTMLALAGEQGDWCIRSDVSDTYVITGDDPSLLVNWTELATPASPVTSVNGQVGAVVLGAADVGAASAAQGTLADTATQPGDNVSDLANDVGYITLAEVPPGGVTSVNTQVGDVVLNATDVGAVDSSGDNMTGDLTLGTDKITLDATAGSAEFGGYIYCKRYAPNNIFIGDGTGGKQYAFYSTAGDGSTVNIGLGLDGTASFAGDVTSGDFSTTTATGALVSGTGAVMARQQNGYGVIWNGLLGNTATSQITADGNATFAGRVKSGDINVADVNTTGVEMYDAGQILVQRSSNNLVFGAYNGTTRTIDLQSDGNATFAGNVQVGDLYTDSTKQGSYLSKLGFIGARRDGTNVVFQGLQVGNNSPTFEVKADGNATFAGTVNVGNIFNASGGIRNNADGTMFISPVSSAPDTAELFTLYKDRSTNTDKSVVFTKAGSATFAGNITGGGWNVATAQNNFYLADGFFALQKDGAVSSASVFNVFNGGNNNSTLRLQADGTIQIGGTLPDAPNIALKADGTATFAGRVDSASGFKNTGDYGFNSFSNKTGPIITINNAAGNDPKFIVNNDGSVLIGGTLTSLPNISLNANGSATFDGTVQAGGQAQNGGAQGVSVGSFGAISAARTTASSSVFSGYTVGNSTATSFIKADGSATFSGTVTANAFVGDGSGLTNLPSSGGGTLQTVTDAGNTTTNSAFFGAGLTVWKPANNTALTLQTPASNSNTAFLSGKSSVGSLGGSGTTTFIILADGSASFSGTVTATVVPPSDARFKENITPAKPQLADVVALGGILKNYDWNEDAPVNDELRAVRQLGLVAQEAEVICPGIVKDLGSEEDRYKGISQDALVMKLLGAVAELTAEVAVLRAQVEG